MIWNKHLREVPEGAHAFLGASQYHWLNYDEEKLIKAYNSRLAAAKGTEDHDFARRCIVRGQRLPKSNKTLNRFVNDAVGFKMEAEQPLYFSENCFGTADAISFKNNLLRVHDLKTGVIPARMEQLFIYVALFCLEYDYAPESIAIECRIYQNDDVVIETPEPHVIREIIDKIIFADKVIQKLRTA